MLLHLLIGAPASRGSLPVGTKVFGPKLTPAPRQGLLEKETYSPDILADGVASLGPPIVECYRLGASNPLLHPSKVHGCSPWPLGDESLRLVDQSF